MKHIGFLTVLFCAALILAEAKAKPLIFLPFKFGTYWWCTQGNGGSYTHKGSLFYAYDFNQIKSINSPADPAYGKPVYAPMEGTVHQVVNSVPDFQSNYGSNSSNNNGWGNVVLLEDEATGKCLRMCHFMQNSIMVKEGQHVQAGAYLGKLGMTGWSTNPHLHIHLQANCSNSASVPLGFVEGPIVDDSSWNTYNRSELMPRSSILDENGSTNLGNYFDTAYVTKSGYWKPGYLTDGFVGDNYLWHDVTAGDTSKFTWHFSVKKTGFYIIFVKWSAHPACDHKTKYTVFGKVKYRSQNMSIFGNWHYLGWGFLSPYKNYAISVQGTTPKKYINADAVILIKL